MPNIRLPFTNVRVVGHVPESLKKPTVNQSANQPVEADRRGAAKPYQKDISLGFIKFRKINPKFVNPQGETALHLAAEKGDLAAIKHLLKNKHVDVNAQDRHGETALHRAAKNGRLDVVLALLANEKADPGLKNLKGETALHLAVKKKHPEIARKLLEDNRIDPNQKNDYGETPLHLAVSKSRISGNLELLFKDDDAVSALLANEKVDTEIKNNDGETALHLAVKEKHPELVQKLLEDKRVDPNQKNNSGQTPLHLTLETGGNSEIVQLLLKDHRSDPGQMIDDSGRTLLHHAISCGGTNPQVVKLLLEDGRIDPNLADKEGNPAILSGMSAAPYRRESIKMMLEDDRVNPGVANKKGETLLLRMARCKDMGIVKKLLADNRVDPNGMLPLLQESPDDAVDMFKSAIPDLASQPTGVDSLIKVLEYMADFKPANGAPNRILTARTNFHLGQVLVEADNPERKGECPKDAVFRFTLALEQLRNHVEEGTIDIKEYAGYAKALLDAAPDAKQFNLGGLPVLRSDIEDVALEHGTEITNLKIKQNINGPTGQIVHQDGFLLRGQALLKAIQDRNANYETKSIDQVKTEIHEAISGWGDKDLLTKEGRSAKEGLKLAMEKNVSLQFGSLNADTEAVIREMWTYIQNESEERKQGSIHSFLNRLITVDEKKLSAEQAAEELLKTSIEIEGLDSSEAQDLGQAQLLYKIQTANQSRPNKSIQQIAAEITKTIEERLARGEVAQKGLEHALHPERIGAVNEGGLDTDVKTVMREMWNYIHHQPEELKNQLTEAFLSRLVDIGGEQPCNTGCVQRILDAPAGIDPSLTHNQPDSQMIKEEIMTMAREMKNDFEEGLQEDYPSSPGHASSSQADGQPNDDEIVTEVKKDLLSAVVMERLIRQRGWDRKIVDEHLKPVLDNIEYL